MKILELDLRAFGPFTDVRLDLAEGQEGMHIIYGPNEAGKSSALRALKCLLYGIPKNSADNFIHDNRALRIGGRLRNADGSVLAFLRRKGNKDTFLGNDGRPADERLLGPFLHGVTEETFGLLFGIDHEALVQGGRNLLEGRGEAGKSLFAAASGGPNLQALLEAIEEDAESLFKRKGQHPTLNREIGRYQELRRKILELAHSGRDWAEKQKEFEEVMAERNSLWKAIEHRTAELNRMQRLAGILPKAGLLKESRARLETLRGVVILPEGFAASRHQAEKQLSAADEVKRRAELDLARLNNEIEKIALPQKLLDQAGAIEAIRERLGQYRKAAADLGNLKGRLQQNKADIRGLLAELAPGRDMQAVKSMRPTAALKSRLQQLASRHQSLQGEIQREERALREAESKLKRLKADLERLEAPLDPGPLKKSLARAAKSGDLGAAVTEAEKMLQQEERQALSLLERLPLWNLPFERVGRVPLPTPETIHRFEEAFSNGRAFLENLEKRLEDARSELHEVEQKIDAILTPGAVPTEEDLQQARERRQRGWSLVKRAWLAGEDLEGESRAYDPDRDLAAAYEASVEQADDTADRLRRDAARVAEYAALRARKKTIEEKIVQLEIERGEGKKKLAQNFEEWKLAWNPAGIEPLTPREMRGWLEQYGKIVQRLEKAGEHRAQIEKFRGKIGELREELNRRLEDLGEKTSSAQEPFAQLLERCESFQERLEKAARRRAELEVRCSEAADEIDAHRQAHGQAGQRLSGWHTEWSEAVRMLGLDVGTPPDEALVLLAKFDDLYRKIDESEGLEQRIFGIERDAEQFHAEVRALVGHVAPELKGLPSDQAADQLGAELTRARRAAARHEEITREIEAKKKVLSEAERDISLAKEKLDSLCRQAGCETTGELEAREKLSAEFQELKKRIHELETDILERGGGADLPQVLQEAEMVDADALVAKIEEAQKNLEELKWRQSELDERVGSLRSELARIDGSSAAAEAAAEAQGVLASIRDQVDDYVKFRLASLVLRRAIERYRTQNQGPILDRAGTLFSRLTLGSFAGLRTESGDSGEPVLVGVRPDGREVEVTGMSDGTLDQLYLALRLATLEKYLQEKEPMPFVVDDILIRFDDDRARATMEVLAELSRRTQVLFFTHHARLAELANSLPIDSGLFLHEL